MPTNNRIVWPLVIALLVIAAILFYVWRPKPNDPVSELQKIKVAQTADFFLYLPLYIAKDKGFFQAQGLDVDIVSTGGDDKTFAAVISGDAQFGIADPTFVAIAQSQGQPGQVVASIVNGVPFWGVAKKPSIPDIKDAKQLNGYTVATFPSPSTAYALQRQMFVKAGLAPKIREAAFGTLLAQLDTGQADIALELEPNVSTAVGQGNRVVYSMADMYGDFAITGVSTSGDIIQRNPELVQKFVNAIEQALKFAHEHSSEAADLAAKRFPSLDRKVVDQALARVLATKTLPTTTVISPDAWAKAVQLRIDSGDLKTTVEDSRKALNNTFAQKAGTAVSQSASPAGQAGK